MIKNKRFTLTNPKNSFQEMKCGIDDRSNTLTFNEVVIVLNNLSDENQKLKKENNKWIVDYNGLGIEYEWLKKENKDLKQMVDFYKDFQKDARELEEENRLLKQFIKQNCPICGANLELFYEEQEVLND